MHRAVLRAAEGAFYVQTTNLPPKAKNGLYGRTGEKRRDIKMKSPEVIDKIEKTLPKQPRRCHYCGHEPREYVRADVNFDGASGFVATMRCTGCGISVFAFGSDIRSALIMAKSYWEKGVCDA